MTDYLEQLQQQKHFWLHPTVNSLPALSINRVEKPLTFNLAVGSQKDLSHFYSTYSIWKPLTSSSSSHYVDHDSDSSSSLSSIMSSASLLSLDQKELYQNSRNILITNIPQDYYQLVVHMVKALGEINDMLEQTCSNYITMVVIFYDLRQVKDLYDTLTRFLQTKMELCHVGLDVCDNQLVASTFGIPLDNFQDTHLSVTLRGNSWALTMIDYKRLLESYGPIHYYKQPNLSDNGVRLVVEYLDTRVAVATQKALDGMNFKDVIFGACLFKPEAEQGQSLINRTHLQAIPESPLSANSNSLLLSPWSPKLEAIDNTPLIFNTPLSGCDNLDLSFFSHHKSQPSYTITATTRHQSLSKPIRSSSRFMFANNQRSNVPSIKENIVPDNTSCVTRVNPSLHTHGDTQTKRHFIDSDITPPQPILPFYTTLSPSNIPTDAGRSRAIPLPASRYIASSTSYSTIPNPPLEPPKTKITDLQRRRRPSALASASASSESRPQSNVIDLKRVINKQDTRTTFMIRNIPNKYNQAMLTESIDATHKGSYDFLYLRIDFQNRCNVGYAFINFIDANSIVSFAKQRRGKQWNRFNSEKICELAYANIQGKSNLIQKFRNSTVMTQDITYRPKIFYSDGIHKGEEEPFPEPDHPIPITLHS